MRLRQRMQVGHKREWLADLRSEGLFAEDTVRMRLEGDMVALLGYWRGGTRHRLLGSRMFKFQGTLDACVAGRLFTAHVVARDVASFRSVILRMCTRATLIEWWRAQESYSNVI